MPETRAIDHDKLKVYAKHVFDCLAGAMTSTMIYLGDQLGLFRALSETGPADSAQLAAKTGLDERWLREWLHQQGAAGVLEHQGDGRFSLSPEGTALMADETHPAFGAGFFSHLPKTMAVAERLPEAFRSGLGLAYDELGPEGAAGVERGFAPWFRNMLVPMALPAIEGLVPRLEVGIAVADVGCGAGVALLEMASAYPKSHFHGYEISEYALKRAEENRAEAALENVHFHNAAREPLPEEPSFDFITTFDCLHDMTDPAGVVGAIRRAIRPDGMWFIADIKSLPTYEENVEKNPMAAMMYGFSVTTCMSSALSKPGGAGLGTLGLHPKLAEEMARNAGFTQFAPVDLPHPMNAFYLARP